MADPKPGMEFMNWQNLTGITEALDGATGQKFNPAAYAAGYLLNKFAGDDGSDYGKKLMQQGAVPSPQPASFSQIAADPNAPRPLALNPIQQPQLPSFQTPDLDNLLGKYSQFSLGWNQNAQ